MQAMFFNSHQHGRQLYHLVPLGGRVFPCQLTPTTPALIRVMLLHDFTALYWIKPSPFTLMTFLAPTLTLTLGTALFLFPPKSILGRGLGRIL